MSEGVVQGKPKRTINKVQTAEFIAQQGQEVANNEQQQLPGTHSAAQSYSKSSSGEATAAVFADEHRVPQNFSSLDISLYVQNLIVSTPKNRDELVQAEIDKILNSCANIGRKELSSALSQILSALISSLLESGLSSETKSARQRWFHSQVSNIFLGRRNVSRTTIIWEALETASKELRQDLDKVLERFLITCNHLLSPLDSISITAAIVQRGSFNSDNTDISLTKARKSLVQTVLASVEKIEKQKNNSLFNYFTQDLVEEILYLFATQESFTNDPQLNKIAQNAAFKLAKLYPDSQQSLTMDHAHHTLNINSDSSADPSTIVNILANVGPACTNNPKAFRETLREVTLSSADGLNEAAVAILIYFLSDKKSSGASKEDDNLSLAILGSLLPHSVAGNGDGNSTWNLDVVSQVLAEDYPGLNWSTVARNLDFPNFQIRSAAQFNFLLNLYRSASKMDIPSSSILSGWKNQVGQFSLLEHILTTPSNQQGYVFKLDAEETKDAATAGSRSIQQGWACATLIHRLLLLSDNSQLSDRVRLLIGKAFQQCPEVLLCSLVRMQINNVITNEMDTVIQELVNVFFKPSTVRHQSVQNGPAVIRRLWEISPNTVASFCMDVWRSVSSQPPQSRLEIVVHIHRIFRLIPESMNIIMNNSIAKDYQLGIAIAFVMADNDMIKLRTWLSERATASGTPFILSLLGYLSQTFPIASPRNTGGDTNSSPLLSLENLALSLHFIGSLDPSLLNQTVGESSSATILESLKGLTEACLIKYPNLKDTMVSLSKNASSSSNSTPPPSSSGSADEIEEMANLYFQKIYNSEKNVDEIIEMLKRFKVSGSSRENDIFACMIHNLFDEYRFFPKYPEKELRITGKLFGKLIQNQLVSSITLGIALRYVLEALRKPPGPGNISNTTSIQGKMFRFGMFALDEFKERLHEWPQYCSHIVQIPHLKQGYAELIAEIETAMSETQSRGSTGSNGANDALPNNNSNNNNNSVQTTNYRQDGGGETSVLPNPPSVAQNNKTSNNQSLPLEVPVPASNELSNGVPNISSLTNNMGQLSFMNSGENISLPSPALSLPVIQEPRKAVFGPNLGRAVNGQISGTDKHESPQDTILDRVQFLINNVSPSNVESKAMELKELLAPQFFGWLGNYLVVKRISTQPNFHSLYLAFLDSLGDYGKGLVEAILSSVYVNIGNLLRSPKITVSTSERSLLKNLGSWLGQITLARNRPILQIMLDCKELLFQGYETGMLIAVTPFVAKILEGAKNSLVFRPPNPWLMGLLSVFRALYGVDDLKMNIKFEVEVLCKNLGVKLEDIPLRTDDLAKRIPPQKERNPDFNMKSSINMGHPPGAMGAANATSSNSVSNNPSAGATMSGADGKQNVGSLSLGDAARQFPNAASIASTTSSQQNGSYQDIHQTVIPNLASFVTINPNLQSILGLSSKITSASLKKAVPVAVDRAIREIIQPVVERSVTIACITTKEIVTKDFAMESDEQKMLKAAQLMVANLAGSLALVTCREPLRASMSTHLRQLLSSNNSNASNGANNNSSGGSNANVQLTEQEQETIDKCVTTCSSENLELGCMLIEKAATEKAVRDMEEALGPALSARKKHREQTGQPFYDMSIFGSGHQNRYPAALPEPLRPKPGGLRKDQLLVYEAFQRLPRAAAQPQQANVNGDGSAAVSGVGNARAPGPGGEQKTDDSFMPSSSTSSGPSARLGLEALSTIASKLDSAVTTILSSVGSHRSSEITLGMLPPENEIQQLLLAVQRVGPAPVDGGRIPLSPKETDAVLVFAQSVFKRLYDLSLTEPLRLETFVGLLQGMNELCPKLGQDLGTWATYAPTDTESQRTIHRTVLLLLARSHLIPVGDLDTWMAKSMDAGKNAKWVEFSLLFVRTAILERITTVSKLSNVIDTLRAIGEGRSQAPQPILSTYRKPILRFLEEISRVSEKQQNSSNGMPEPRATAPVAPENNTAPENKQLTHQQSSSMGPVSLHNLAAATKKALDANEATARNDPPGWREQVTFLLDSFIRLNSEVPGSEKALAQYLQLLQQHGVGKIEEHTERFFRVSTELVVESALKSSTVNSNSEVNKQASVKALNYSAVDAYAKLVSLLIRYMNSGGTAEQVASQRITLLNKVLGVTMRSLMASYEKNKNTGWDQRPWFRLLLNLVHDLNAPNPALDPISIGILTVFGGAFHVVQPLVVPGFAFAWLELISHRMFLSNLLLSKGQKGWNIAHQLLIDLFLFLEPHLRKVEMTDAFKVMYKGTLRVLLVLLHDFPSFLAGYHLSFCNVIPENCVQLRNLILSAFPRGMVLPDPFTPNLKIDLLSEISQSPAVLSNVLGPMKSFQPDLDSYLKSRQPQNFLNGLLPRLYKEGTTVVDAARVNSFVLYVGTQAINRLPQKSLKTPEMDVLQRLMDFDARGRYVSLNAIANQLRYPSSHTHYFSCVMLYLFSETKDEGVKEQITRVLLERLIVHRPHPWGLLITFIELIKNQRYQFWNHQFTRCATEIEKVFESVARSCLNPDGNRVASGEPEIVGASQ